MPRHKAHTDAHDPAEAHAQDQHEAGEHSESHDNPSNGRENGAAVEQTQDRNAGAQANAEAPESSQSPTMHRAEEMVDHLAERVGHYAGVVGQKLMWFFARAREEAEDIWAEAQAIRRGEHAEQPQQK